MSTSDGQVTNAVYGFTSMLAIVLASRPEFAVAAFDVGAPTFRSKEYAEYKAGRRAMPDDLRPQIEKVREVLESFSIPIYGIPGFEADDVIGTLARIAEERGHSVTIVSGDLDCLQLVTESVEALVPRRGITDTFVYGPDQVRQRYGFEPPQLIDFKALRGDTSDNIPGVPGVGDKTAAKLVQDFVSVEGLLERVDELPEGRLKTSLKANADRVRLGKRMVTIVRDVPVELELEKARWAEASVTGRSARFWPPTSWGRARGIRASRTWRTTFWVWSSSAPSSCWAQVARRGSPPPSPTATPRSSPPGELRRSSTSGRGSRPRCEIWASTISSTRSNFR